MAKTVFSSAGSKNRYTVVAEGLDMKWGMAVEIEHGVRLVVRFATLGISQEPPKIFPYRGKQIYNIQGGESVGGVMLVKKVIPLLKAPVNPTAFKEFVETMEVADLVAEWALRQFKQEGVQVYDDADLPGLISASWATQAQPEEEPVKPIFTIPLDFNYIPPTPAVSEPDPDGGEPDDEHGEEE